MELKTGLKDHWFWWWYIGLVPAVAEIWTLIFTANWVDSQSQNGSHNSTAIYTSIWFPSNYHIYDSYFCICFLRRHFVTAKEQHQFYSRMLGLKTRRQQKNTNTAVIVTKTVLMIDYLAARSKCRSLWNFEIHFVSSKNDMGELLSPLLSVSGLAGCYVNSRHCIRSELRPCWSVLQRTERRLYYSACYPSCVITHWHQQEHQCYIKIKIKSSVRSDSYVHVLCGVWNQIAVLEGVLSFWSLLTGLCIEWFPH